MIKQTSQLYTVLNETLAQIALTSENNLQRAERSYQAIEAALNQVKKFILDYHFKNPEEEIRFFKEIKPMFLSQLIYHQEVFYIEAKKPLSNKTVQSDYYKQVNEQINVFFERHHLLYIYYRMGKTDYDGIYFVRGADVNPLQPEYSLDIDTRFSTLKSFKLSKLQAYEQLNEYLQHSLYLLDHPNAGQNNYEAKKHKNHWTDSKAALIELAYAIHARGSVNQGKGDVKQLISELEILFNVELGNFYRMYQNMRIRKKNRTAYLDVLKESLERRMDDGDLNYS